MNANEVKKLARQLARVVAVGLVENWDRVRENAKGDPKGMGVASVTAAMKISTSGQGNHQVTVTIAGRSHKEAYSITPTDLELPDGDQDLNEDPGEQIEP